MERAKLIVRWLLTFAFLASGITHLRHPEIFLPMMPDYLPSPLLLVYVSGVAEIAGGVGLQAPWPDLRRYASYGCIALLVAVFPANLHQAIHDVPMNGQHLPAAVRWGRLPLQLVLVWLAWWCTSRPRAAK